MGYEIMMCVMALFVNLLVVGCFALVYGTKMKYENGMLFGIHMPKEAQKDPEVQSLMEQYAVRVWGVSTEGKCLMRKQIKWFPESRFTGIQEIILIPYVWSERIFHPCC